MNPFIFFFLNSLFALLLAMVLAFVLWALQSIRQQLGMKRIIVFALLAGLFLGLPSLFGYLKNEYVWGGLVLTVTSYLILGFFYLWALRVVISKKNDDMSIELLVTVLSGIIGMWIYYLVFTWIFLSFFFPPWF